MKDRRIVLILGLVLIALALASSVDAASFSLSRDSVNQVTSSIGGWFKGNMFTWYTTDSLGQLKPEYEMQRKIVDFILFFIMFFSLSLLGLKKAFKDGGNALNALALSIGALMSLALVAFTKVTLGLLFPFAKNILFFIILLVVYLILAKLLGEKMKILALILAVIITWLAFSYLGEKEGWLPFKFGDFNMQKSSKEIPNPANAKEYLQQGRFLMEQQKYDEAKDMFVKVIQSDPNPITNKYFDDALNYLRDGMFDHMANNMLDVIEAETYAGEIMAGNPQWQGDAIPMLNQVIEHSKKLQGEIENQQKRIEEMKQMETKLRQIK